MAIAFPERWLRTCACIILSTAAGTSLAATSPDGDSVEAIWKPQRVSFVYRGYTTLYNCRSLEDKLEVILQSVGARDDLQLDGYACNEQMGIARFQVLMRSPVVATEENVRALTTYDSKDDLVARLNGVRLETTEDVQRFPAVWKTISFSRDRRMRLEPGDCELVEQLRRQILPRMSVQVVKDNVRCSRAFGNINRPRLIVSALVPASTKQAASDPQ